MRNPFIFQIMTQYNPLDGYVSDSSISSAQGSSRSRGIPDDPCGSLQHPHISSSSSEVSEASTTTATLWDPLFDARSERVLVQVLDNLIHILKTKQYTITVLPKRVSRLSYMSSVLNLRAVQSKFLIPVIHSYRYLLLHLF